MQKDRPSGPAGAEGANAPAESVEKSRYSEFLEVWKKVADRKAHLIFASLPLRGPDMTDELKKDAAEQLHRLTWPEACRGMSDAERIAVWRANQEAMDGYASNLVDKVAAEQCAPAGS